MMDSDPMNRRRGVCFCWKLGPFTSLPRSLAYPWLRTLPSGDGHPVMVLPGLVASDRSTRPLRTFLRNRGYGAHGWELGRNLGVRPGLEDQQLARLRELRRRYGRKVSLIGWSLGGVYARELAKRAPEEVRLVITLGSPFKGDARATHATRLYELLAGHTVEEARATANLPSRHPCRPQRSSAAAMASSPGSVAWRTRTSHREH